MKNYTDSDYALNKYSAGIVYRFADGIVEVTLADYLAGNPGKSEADFRVLKELSDGIYLEQARDKNAQTKRNAPYGEPDEAAPCHAPSPEDLLIGEIDAREEALRHEQREETAARALGALTEVQRRRYLLYHMGGLTVREISEVEGAHFTAVHESLKAAEKKIKKFLARGQKHPYKPG
jgi:hypothetical protein